MKSKHARRAAKLGMPHGTAAARLRKALMFKVAGLLGLLTCFRCERQIETAAELSVEHKDSWELAADPAKAFFDLDNVAFSHLSCNCEATSRRSSLATHGAYATYQAGCRCDLCREAKRQFNGQFMKAWRASGLDKSRSNFKGA